MRASVLLFGQGGPQTVDRAERASLRTNTSRRSGTSGHEWQTCPMNSVRRLLPRDSSEPGIFDVNRITDGTHWRLLTRDLYHTAIHMPLRRLLLVFVCVYVTAWSAFAAWWMLVSDPCDIELTNFRRAFYLSMESMMTIGYGVPDPYFDDCNEVIPLITCEALFGLLLDAAFLNTLYQRLSSAYSRGSSIVFSEVSLLNVVEEAVQWSCRICEMRRQHLLEPTVRAFCVKHVPNGRHPDGVEVQVLPLRLSEPDSEIGEGKLFLSLPVTVAHQVDWDSPLAPPAPRRNGCEEKIGLPSSASVQEYLKELPFLELIIIVGGSDGISGNSLEALQSYVRDEMMWDHVFVPCLSTSSGAHAVDFVAFHETEEAESQEIPKATESEVSSM